MDWISFIAYVIAGFAASAGVSIFKAVPIVAQILNALPKSWSWAAKWAGAVTAAGGLAARLQRPTGGGSEALAWAIGSLAALGLYEYLDRKAPQVEQALRRIGASIPIGHAVSPQPGSGVGPTSTPGAGPTAPPTTP